METNAIQSLYGAKQALTGNVGAQDRPQEILTPDYILEAATKALGGYIGLDPCATADPSKWFAEENWCLGPEVYAIEAQIRALTGKDKETKKARAALKKQRKKLYLAGPGLTRPWYAPAFVNFPYEFCEAWLRACAVSAFGEPTVCGSERPPRVVLAPVRPWRKWWVQYARMADQCVWLSPVTFVGQKQPLPMPMCLLAFGCEIPQIGKYETGRSKI